MSRIKSLLLLLPAALIAGYTPAQTTAGRALHRAEQATGFSESQLNSVKSFFSGNYRATSTVQLSYLSNGTIEVIDEVGPEARFSSVYTNLDGERALAGSTAIIADEDGNASAITIGLSNEAVETPVQSYNDSDGTYSDVSFADAYGSPMGYLADISSENFAKHFTVTESESGYTLTADSIALAYFAPEFINFFPLHDGCTWDSLTASSGLLNVDIVTDTEGTPISMDFTTYASDRFGMTTESYTTTLEAIDSVRGVDLYKSNDDDEHQKLASAISSLSSKLSEGNFTETIDVSGFTSAYHNYYDLKNTKSNLPYGAMLSDNVLVDSSYGDTYTGILNYPSEDAEDTEGDYYTIGISPDEDYSSALDETPYDTLEDVIPQIGQLSDDFFTYDESSETYTFDLTDPRVATSSFSVKLISALFGYGDAQSARIATYCDDTSAFTYDFHTLTIALDSTGEFASATLNYNSAYLGDENATTTVTFSDFGTTDLSAHEDLASALEILKGM